MESVSITHVLVILLTLFCCMFFRKNLSRDAHKTSGMKGDTEFVPGDIGSRVNFRKAETETDTDLSTSQQKRLLRCFSYSLKCPCLLGLLCAVVKSKMAQSVFQLYLGSNSNDPGQEEAFSIRKNSRVAIICNSAHSNDCSFPYFSGYFRSFYGQTSHESMSCQERHHIDAALCLAYLCRLIVLLAMIHKNMAMVEDKQYKENVNFQGIHFRNSFARTINRKHWNQKCILPKKFTKQYVYFDNILQYSFMFYYQVSVRNTLEEYIFRPWRSKLRVCNTVLLSDHHGSADQRVSGSVFSACQEQNSFFRSHIVMIQVYPASRFLPEPTLNPDIDFSHVGYRLAALGALPSTVPVSRVKLADAGFYFRGHGEEVTCYSCHVRVSNWPRGGDPMDIHRTLSPQCQHVLARDHELASLASRSYTGMHVSPARTEDMQSLRSWANWTAVNSHIEDSEGVEAQAAPEHSETHTSASVAATSKTTSLPLKAAHSSAHGSRGPGMTMAVSAPANGGFVSHAGISSLNSAPPDAITTADANIINAHAQTAKVQSSAVNLSTSSTSLVSTSSAGGTNMVPLNTTAESISHVQMSSAISVSGCGVNVNSAGGRLQHLFPQAWLDLGQAVYPMYESMSIRRRTFTSAWNSSRTPPLEEVLMSGMFYAGYADCVRCFYCGVGLKNWEGTDNVWTEHVRWRPHCGFLRAIKGDDFIRTVQRQLGVMGHGIQSQGSSPPLTTTSRTSASTTQVLPASEAELTVSVLSTASSGSSITSTTTTTSTATVPSRTVPVLVSSATAITTIGCAPASETACKLMKSTGTVGASSAAAASFNDASTSAGSLSVASSSGTVSVSSVLSAASTSATVSAVVASTSRQGAVVAVPPAQVSRGGDGRRGGGEERLGGVSFSSSHDEQAERDRLARLQEENRQLAQRLHCRLCRQASIDTIFMPCGHLVVCAACAPTVRTCPLCHQTVRATAHVYLSS